MTRGTRHFDPETAEQRVRRPLRVAQPESTASLRPSLRRAAENRASLTGRAPSIEVWVRDFGASTGRGEPDAGR
jgi:FAD/FMN-containing dehydrogenase